MSEDKKEDKVTLITLDQFRAWLEGVEEMQEDGWTPDVRQWTKIREKIDMIRSQPAPAQPAPFVPHPAANVPVQQTVPPPSAFDQVTTQPAPRAPIQLNPDAPIANDPTGKVPVKAPDIDTSDGNYKSSFE